MRAPRSPIRRIPRPSAAALTAVPRETSGPGRRPLARTLLAPALVLLGGAGPPPLQTLNAPAEVIVPAPKPAKLALSFPAEGAIVPGGTAVLKLVFDQPMSPDAWSYDPVPGAVFPACLKRPRLLADRRTFVLLCSLPLNSDLAISVNGVPDFRSAAGRAPPPVTLRFKTNGDATVSLADALKNAGLTDADDPIMSEEPSKGAVIAAPVDRDGNEGGGEPASPAGPPPAPGAGTQAGAAGPGGL